MKKKKILFAILLLLIIAIPFSIVFGNFDNIKVLKSVRKLSASVTTDDDYRYSNYGVSASNIFGEDIPGFCVASGACHDGMSTFWMHEAILGDEDAFYHGYCLHMGKTADGFGRPNLTAYIYDDNFDSNVITNRNGQAISDSQLELLQDFLASGYHWDNTHTTTIYQNVSREEQKIIFVRQIIVWEIIEGGRTNFNNVPSYSDSDSAYSKVISADSDLAAIYKRQLKEASDFRSLKNNGPSASIFGNTYTMSWDNNVGKYSTGVLNGLGGFWPCSSSTNGIIVAKSDDIQSLVVLSDSAVSSATITCEYKAGDGSNKWTYYKFNGHRDWQDVINGVGGITIKKSFTVKTEESKVKVVKINSSNQAVSGAKFTLTLNNDSSVKFDLDGNGSAKTIVKSGTYILSETNPPYGYGSIANTEITINVSNKTITSSNTKQVQVAYANNEFKITVRDEEKHFEIRKFNQSGGYLKGAKFRIYNGNGFSNQVKFDKTDSRFSYNANGSVGDIYDANYSIYELLFLPKGIYKIVEISVPAPYVLPTKEADRTYYIKVQDNYDVFDCGTDSKCSNPKRTVQNSMSIKNYTTEVVVNKIGNGGKQLSGVKFLLLLEDKTTYVKSTGTGTYSYADTTADITQATVYETVNGIIKVTGIPTGTYYFKEIETISPYSLPDGDDAYTKVTVDMKTDGQRINGSKSSTVSISNATQEFNFYKVDENGNYLSGGKFKIQKFNNDTGKYEDLKIKSVTNDGTYQSNADVFKVDKNGKVQFTLTNGIATFIEMEANTTYRIVELEAPKGYQVANVENSAIIKIDSHGYAKGSATIINQNRSLEGSTAQAELIIEIQTGQSVIRYGLIITGTLIVIGGLMVLLVYVSKKRK